MKTPLFVVTVFLIGLVDSNQRIYGGYKMDVTRAPYMVGIVINVEQYSNGLSKVHECGGTILRTNLILTAAHCNVNTKNNRKPYTRENFIVISGTNKIDPNPDGATFHSVKTVFVHPKYLTAKDNRFHDVGLLELNNEIKLGRRAQLVQLARPTDRPATGADCTVTGYGTNPDHPKDAHSLYQVHLKVIAAEQCAEELADGTVEEVEQHNICAKAEGKNQCKGDSGGPLHDVSTNRQVGIVSYGARDCTADYPSIDCRVTDNLDYIEEIIKQTSGGESDIPPNGSSCTNPAHF